MELTPVHLLLVLIIIIAVCADILTIPVAIGLIVAAIAIFVSIGGIKSAESLENKPKSQEPPKSIFDEGLPWQNQSILNYPQESITQQALNTSYGTCYDPIMPVVGSSVSELDGSIDAELTLLSQKRQRDKKTSDGWALKDADYFRHNYSWELDLEESKPWWGNAEY